MQNLIRIKGGKNELRMHLDEAAEWQVLLRALQVQFDQGGSFFAGAQFIIDIGDRHLQTEQLTEMLTLMHQYGLHPESLAATMRESREAARSAGLNARATQQRKQRPESSSLEQGEATWIFRTVRSGQVIRSHGHLTLIGDVNAGAQIIAGGSVVVWGRLRGLVHAGALGDMAAVICALELRPTQLRIAHFIARTPEEVAASHPEVARVEQDHIIVEAWEAYKRG